MEVFPDSPVAPFWPSVLALRGCGVDAEEEVDVGVARHRRQLLAGGPRVAGMRMAPPEHRLHALEGREPPVVAENSPELGVDASLYPIVGRRERAGLGARDRGR